MKLIAKTNEWYVCKIKSTIATADIIDSYVSSEEIFTQE